MAVLARDPGRDLTAFGLLLLVACGRPPQVASPTSLPSPSPSPNGIAVLALDGITGEPVRAAGPTFGAPGSSADLSATGYFLRRTFIPADGRIYLWPITVEEGYTRRIVYETWSFSGIQRLYRWDRRSLTVTPGMPPAGLAPIIEAGAVTLNESLQPDIEVRVDPDDPDVAGYLGYTRCRTTGYAINHCRVVLRDASVMRSPILSHELGHCLGLGHSLRASDLMNPSGRASAFSADERVLVTMMYDRRRPGNAPPDDDQVLGAQAPSNRILMIRD